MKSNVPPSNIFFVAGAAAPGARRLKTGGIAPDKGLLQDLLHALFRVGAQLLHYRINVLVTQVLRVVEAHQHTGLPKTTFCQATGSATRLHQGMRLGGRLNHHNKIDSRNVDSQQEA